MVLFIAAFKAFQYLDRLGNRRFGDLDFFEPSREGAILFKMVFVFLVGARPDAPQFSRSQNRLQDIGSVHRTTTGRASTNNGMNFIDKQHRIGTIFEFVDHPFESLFKIAPVFGPSKQSA